MEASNCCHVGISSDCNAERRQVCDAIREGDADVAARAVETMRTSLIHVPTLMAVYLAALRGPHQDEERHLARVLDRIHARLLEESRTVCFKDLPKTEPCEDEAERGRKGEMLDSLNRTGSEWLLASMGAGPEDPVVTSRRYFKRLLTCFSVAALACVRERRPSLALLSVLSTAYKLTAMAVRDALGDFPEWVDAPDACPLNSIKCMVFSPMVYLKRTIVKVQSAAAELTDGEGIHYRTAIELVWEAPSPVYWAQALCRSPHCLDSQRLPDPLDRCNHRRLPAKFRVRAFRQPMRDHQLASFEEAE